MPQDLISVPVTTLRLQPLAVDRVDLLEDSTGSLYLWRTTQGTLWAVSSLGAPFIEDAQEVVADQDPPSSIAAGYNSITLEQFHVSRFVFPPVRRIASYNPLDHRVAVVSQPGATARYYLRLPADYSYAEDGALADQPDLVVTPEPGADALDMLRHLNQETERHQAHEQAIRVGKAARVLAAAHREALAVWEALEKDLRTQQPDRALLAATPANAHRLACETLDRLADLERAAQTNTYQDLAGRMRAELLVARQHVATCLRESTQSAQHCPDLWIALCRLHEAELATLGALGGISQ